MEVISFDVDPTSTHCSLLAPLAFKLTYRLPAGTDAAQLFWTLSYEADIADRRQTVALFPLENSADAHGEDTLTASPVSDSESSSSSSSSTFELTCSISEASMARALRDIAEKFVTQVSALHLSLMRSNSEGGGESVVGSVSVVCHIQKPAGVTSRFHYKDMIRSLYSPLS